jgi:hypothetical protein
MKIYGRLLDQRGTSCCYGSLVLWRLPVKVFDKASLQRYGSVNNLLINYN